MNSKEIAIITKDIDSFLINIKQYSIKIYTKFKNVNKFSTDIVIIDSSMKKNETREFIKYIKSDDSLKEISIIVILESEFPKEYCDLEINDYIYKPLKIDELCIRINNQIELKEVRSKLREKELTFNVLLNNIPYMTWMKDTLSNYQIVNREFMEHSGKPIEDIRGNGDVYVWDGKIGDKCKEYDLEVMNKRKRITFNEIIPGKKGYKEFNVHKAPIIDEFNNVLGTIGIARDITEVKNIDAQFKILIENIPFRVWLNDRDGNYINANSKFVKSIDSNVESIIGKNMRDFYCESEVLEIISEDNRVMAEKKPIKFEKIIKESNKERIVEVYKTPVFNIANEVVGIVGTLVDVTDIKEVQDRIKKQANTDILTHIPNRRALYEYINRELKLGDNISIMFIDIDNFKTINDTYGHHFADVILMEVANILDNICNKQFVCRVGGDEFIIIFKEDSDKEFVVKKANEILKSISSTRVYKEQKYNTYVSIGIANCLYDGNMDNLFMKGDMALYKAKESGKNKFEFYTEGLEIERRKKLDIEKELNKAIKKDEIKLFYQPQYNKDNKLIGFEALFRWRNKKYGNLSIIEIISIMEKSNLIIDIGYEILRKACLFAKKINKNRDDKIVVSVNISVAQIMQNDFIQNLDKILKETKVDVNCVAIEITETVFLENINENISKLNKIKDMGIKIALDDFGTGYSSFNYLVELPLSTVKIDQKFVKGIDVNDKYIKLIKLIIDSSHSLNLTIVGEGVETKKQLDILKSMNIDYVQGYLFSKPIEEKEAITLIENN